MKVALYVWNVCTDVVLGKYELDDIGLIVSPTVMKTDEDARAVCDLFSKCNWYGLLNDAQFFELEREGFPMEKHQHYTVCNRERLKRFFGSVGKAVRFFSPG